MRRRYGHVGKMAFYVYIMTNKRRGVLYTGQTDDLNKRAWEHRAHAIKGFTDKYNCEALVWFEMCETRDEALTREKQIKNWRRDWKINLIEQSNPEWRDLADTLL